MMRFLFFIALSSVFHLANAQSFPSKVVRIIVPFAPGGAGDISARLIAENMSPGLGQPVIVENRPGSGAVLAYELAARAAPDGHTMVTVWPSFVINPVLRKVSYDALKDFDAIGQAIALPLVIAVAPSLNVSTMTQLIELGRAKPGTLQYGTPGTGTIQHVLGEMIRVSAKVDLTHIPYQGGGAQVTAVAGGHVPMAVTNVVEAAPHVRSGKVKVIAVTSDTRVEALPEVPTMREAGYPDFSATNWNGMAVPHGTPASAIARLNAELNRALAKPEVQEKLKSQGMFTTPGTPEQFAALIRSEAARYAKVVRDSGMKAD